MKPQTILFSLGLALLATTPVNGARPRDPGDEPRVRHEDCTPPRLVTVLRDQVEWWARTAEPVALAGQFDVDPDAEGARPERVAWRLAVTTLDGELVDERHGETELEGGTGVGLVNFEGKDAGGHPLAAGLYVYRFEAEGFEGSGGFLRVVASDDEPVPPVRDGSRSPLATSSNPYIPYAFYFGSEHAHTIYSDGGSPVATCTGSISSPHTGSNPASAFSKAKANGNVDWITVIEHNHLIDDACGTGCSNATIVGRYQEGISAAASASTSTFVGIYGMEWGVISGGGHIALYDTSKLFSWEAYAEVSTPKSDYLALYTAASNAAYQGNSGATGAFCHPGTSDFGGFAQNAAGLAFMRGLAVISGPATSSATNFADAGTRYSGPKAGSDLYQYALQRGWRIGPEAHADNHCDNYGTITRNRTVVLANGLSKASIMDAKKNRRFYASSDLNAQMFFGTADYSKVMGQQFTTSASTLSLLLWVNDPDGASVSTVTLWQGNPAAGSGSPTSVPMTSAGSGTYTATVTVPASGESYWYAYAALSSGAELFSAPIWVSKAACSDATAPTATITAPSATTVSGTVTVTATATDNVGVTGMTLRIDGATVATSSTGSVSYSWSTSALGGGSSHTITATATDACGNVSPTATKAVTIAAAATYSISGSAGTASATVSSGSASATSDAAGTFAIPGLAAGTYTVTPSKVGCTFSPASRSVTVSSANVTGVTFTATCGGAPTTLFTDGFEGTGWSFANVSGTTGYWTLGASSTHPSASAHGGTKLAAFNSYTCAAGTQKRMYRASGFAVASTYATVTLKLWMYHDAAYSTSADKVQVQVSTDGTSWTSVGTAISRYSATAGWVQATVDLSAYKGKTVYLGFLGISAYGNDIYLDDVTVTAQ